MHLPPPHKASLLTAFLSTTAEPLLSVTPLPGTLFEKMGAWQADKQTSRSKAYGKKGAP